MKEILDLISSYGGLVILAGLFVWTYLQDRKKNIELLQSINNTTEVLKEYLINHDEKAKRIDENVDKLLEKVSEK